MPERVAGVFNCQRASDRWPGLRRRVKAQTTLCLPRFAGQVTILAEFKDISRKGRLFFQSLRSGSGQIRVFWHVGICIQFEHPDSRSRVESCSAGPFTYALIYENRIFQRNDLQNFDRSGSKIQPWIRNTFLYNLVRRPRIYLHTFIVLFCLKGVFNWKSY